MDGYCTLRLRSQWEANSLTYRWGNWRTERERVIAGVRLWILSPLCYSQFQALLNWGENQCGHSSMCVCVWGGWLGHLEIIKPFIFDSCFSFHILPLFFQLDHWIQVFHFQIRKLGQEWRRVRFSPTWDLGSKSLCFLACVPSITFWPWSPILREIYYYRLYRVGQKVCLHLSITSYKKLEWTFWPTQYFISILPTKGKLR